MPEAPPELATAAEQRRIGWAWHPPLPLTDVPVFVRPPRPLAALRFLVSRSYLQLMLPYWVLATVTWLYLQPALERCTTLRVDWILEMYARNLALMLLVAGGLHLYLFAFKRQGTERRFDPRELSENDPRFFARDQVRDNILWSCASGVTIWTAYEVLFMWAYANNWLPLFLDWKAHPVWFVVPLFMIPFWQSLQFYFTHRLLHWRPIYRIAHNVHHRNDNIGPWSGLSMHPIEHVIYMTSALIHLVLLSHPIHLLFHMQWLALGAALSHTGYESLTFRGKPVLLLGSFHHQLHHRFLDCNLGAPFVPYDKWNGTDHDGTPQALAEIRKRRRTAPSVARDSAGP